MRRTILPVIVLALACGAGAHAQPPRGAPSLFGSWRLDADLSDPPEQMANAVRYDTRDPGAGLFAPGPPVGRRGDSDDGRRGKSGPAPKDPLSPSERETVTLLTDAMLRFAPTMLTIAQANGAIVMTNGSTPLLTSHPNGEAETQTVGGIAVKRTTAWEGPVLAIEYDMGHAGTLRCTYFVVAASRQLLVRANFITRTGERGPIGLKLVYDAAP